MKAVFDLLRRERLWPMWVLVLAVVVILTRLWAFGFWEPREIAIADEARQTVSEEADEADEATEAAGADEAAGAAGQDEGPSRAERIEAAEPSLTEWSIARGVEHIGVSELGARLPLALLGIGTILATFFVGVRLGNARAGLLSALVAVSLPLLLFQSRQLMSNIGAACGAAVMVLGLVGLAWPERDRDRHPRWRYGLDAGLVILGGALLYSGARVFLGLMIPLAAVGLASMIALATERRAALDPDESSGPPAARTLNGTRRWRRMHLWIGGGLIMVAALAAFVIVFLDVFEIRDPVPGTRQVLGKSFVPDGEASRALGGVWKERGDSNATFDTLFHQLVFGLFPWIALAPVAAARLALGPRVGRRAWAGYVVFIWAFLTWVVATIVERKVGPVHYPALAAIAVAIGLWIDDLWSARERATGDDAPETRRTLGMPVQTPLVALFVFLCAVVVAKDLQAFPDEITGVHVLEGNVEYPAESGLKKGLLVFGGLFGVTLAMGLWLWRPPIPGSSFWKTLRFWTLRIGPHVLFAAAGLATAWKIRTPVFIAAGILGGAVAVVSAELAIRGVPRLKPASGPEVRSLWYYPGRHGVTASLVIGVGFALFLTQVWTPRLSQTFSSKHLFSVYRDLRASGDDLVIMGDIGSGPDWYADSDYTEVSRRGELLKQLGRDDARVFAVAPASELCAVHRAAAREFDYHVHDNSHASLLLMSNRLESGETDKNPLARAILRERPTDIKKPLDVNFDDKVRLIGVTMPRKVRRGGTFEMTLFFEVLESVGGSWKIFVHFDRGRMRFQGDHEPIGGRCATSYWQPGDYIVDTFEVTAGDALSYSKGGYRAWAGFFYGSHGNWTNMEVVSGDHDEADRVPLGTITVQ